MPLRPLRQPATDAVIERTFWPTCPLGRTLREQGTGTTTRQALVGAGFVAVLAAFFLLMPPATDPGDFPGDVLWDFRISALGTQAVLWTLLGAGFGLLCERTNRRKAPL